MSLLSRFSGWAFPSLPPVDTHLAAPVPSQRFASIVDVLPQFQQGKAIWPTFDLLGAEERAKVALVQRCLNLISHAVGTAPLRVYDEAQDDEEVDDHPLRMLVRQPNLRQGEALFWGTIAVRAALAGFCVVEKERDRVGNVIALNPLRSAWLKAVARGRGVYDWEYRVPGIATVYALKAEDVVPFRWIDTPDGSPYGLSALATVVRDIAILDKLSEFLGNLLDRGGVPMWMLIPDPDAAAMDQEQIDIWTEKFLRRRGGFDRRGVPWYAEGIKEAKQLSYNPTELAMEAVRDLSDLAICQAFGVPSHKAGTRVGLEHVTQNATAAVEDGTFYRDTIVPLWTRFDDAATTGLLPDFEAMPTTRYLGFDRSDIEALQEDRNAKATAIVIPGFGGGLLSNHMALRELGMPIPDGLPEYYLRGISVEAVPAGDPLQLATPTRTTTPPPVVPPPQLGSVRVIQLGPGPSERLAKRKAIGASNRKLIKSVADAREPSVRRFLSAQAERIAAHVKAPLGVALARSNGHVRETYSAAEIDWTRENELLSEVLKSLHLLAGSTAFDAASEQVGVGLSWDLSNPRIRDVIDRLAGKVVDITTATRDLIAEIVTAGEEAGKGVTEIAEDIVRSTGFSTARASTIARTESMFSYGEASALAYKESGVVDRAQIFDNENHPDDYGASDGLTCATRNGIVVPLDEMMDHIYADHPNGSACGAPVLVGEEV